MIAPASVGSVSLAPSVAAVCSSLCCEAAIEALSASCITDNGLSSLAELSLLQRLWLGFTQVSDAGLGHLAGLKKLEMLEIEPESASLQRVPKTTETLDLESARKVLKLIDMIEEDEDVNGVYHNMTLTDEMMELL